MKNKNSYDMHYKHRRDTDTVEVYRPKKFKLYFPGAKSAQHKNDNIEVVSSLNHKITIDQFSIRHW